MTEPNQVLPPAPPEPRSSRALTTSSKFLRRIVVRPDQVFQRDFQNFSRPTFEGVIIRYVLISAAVVTAVSIATMVLTFFFRG